jgi:hypothetical protein
MRAIDDESWQANGRPIPDLDRVDWVERETVIVPDSDVWIRPDLVQPLFALGKKLEGRGAKVAVLKLPPGGDGAKVGLDDYLCAATADSLVQCARLGLTHAACARGRLVARVGQAHGTPSRRRASPASSSCSSAGRQRGGCTPPSTSPTASCTTACLSATGSRSSRPGTRGSRRRRSHLDSRSATPIRAHPRSGTRRRPPGLVAGPRARSPRHSDGPSEFLRRHVALGEPGAALWLAAWALGTWCYRVFRVFPYLSLRSAERRCGKSRLMRLLCRVSFNASPPTTHPTEAQLYREAARRSGAQAFDEMESLKGGGDKERLAALISC